MNENEYDDIEHEAIVEEELVGARVDKALAILFPDYSREKLKSWILSGECLVNNKKVKPKDKVNLNDKISISAQIESVIEWQPQNIPLDIIYEDEDIIVVNKPTNLVVHPGSGNKDGTLVNALLYHANELANLPRGGIVHRLDKDTSGLMVVARSLAAHSNLVKQLSSREVSRTYNAIVHGHMISGGTIDAPIGRHNTDRKKMAVTESGKEAITHYRIEKKYSYHTHISLKLETGRTHQIRVHMAYLNHPLIGDKVYGGRPRVPAKASNDIREYLSNFPRQALHARALSFIHPTKGEEVSFEVPLPDDFMELLSKLDEYEQQLSKT